MIKKLEHRSKHVFQERGVTIMKSRFQSLVTQLAPSVSKKVQSTKEVKVHLEGG